MNPLRWRKITWALDVWIVLFVIWMIAGLNSPSGTCEATPFNSEGACGGGYAEIGDGTRLIFVAWCFGFIVLSFVWLTTSGRARPPK